MRSSATASGPACSRSRRRATGVRGCPFAAPAPATRDPRLVGICSMYWSIEETPGGGSSGGFWAAAGIASDKAAPATARVRQLRVTRPRLPTLGEE